MLYTYEAFDKNGTLTKGEVDAIGEKEAILYLEQKELIPVKVRAQDTSKKKGISFSLFGGHITPTDRIFLVRNLATALKAGLTITEAIEILVQDTKKESLKNILLEAKVNLQNGQPLSQTFASYPELFPPVFIGLIKAGESASQLDKTLEELAHHLMKEYALVKKVKSAMVYPFILLMASVGVVAFLLIFVLPRLEKTFATSGAELPGITVAIIGASRALTYSISLDIVIFLAFVGMILYVRKTAGGRRFSELLLMKTPVVKGLIQKVALVRFTRTLGSLLSGAVPILESLRIASDSSGNEAYKKAILQSAEQVRSGIPFSKTFAEHPNLFPPLLTSLLTVGERTGTLEYVLKTFSDFYDEEVDNKLKDVTTLFEPVLLLVMGLIVGTIAISVLLPIYQLVGEFT